MTSVGSAISVSESRPAMTSIMVINPGPVFISALVTSVAVFIDATSILKSIRIELVELSITRRRRSTSEISTIVIAPGETSLTAAIPETKALCSVSPNSFAE